MSKVPVRNKNVGLGTDMSNFFFIRDGIICVELLPLSYEKYRYNENC